MTTKNPNICEGSLDGKLYSANFSVRGEALFVLLKEKKAETQNLPIYKGSYTLEELKKISTFFNQFVDVDHPLNSALDSILKALEIRPFELREESPQIITITFDPITNHKFSLSLSTDPKVEEATLKEVSSFLTQMHTTLNKKMDEGLDLIKQLTKAQNKNDELEASLTKAQEENRLLKEENEYLKATIEKLKAEKSGVDIEAINEQVKKEQQENEKALIDNYDKNASGDLMFKSKIVLDKYSKALLYDWIKSNTKISTTLIYRATRDGDGSAEFHGRCNGNSPTITIIKTTAGRIFGGFTTQKWDNSALYQKDPKAFIFSLDEKKKYLQDETAHSIYCGGDYGPTFGYSQNGHDIYISNNCFTNTTSYSQTPSSYDVRPGFALTKGVRNFRVAEIEVYKIEGYN